MNAENQTSVKYGNPNEGPSTQMTEQIPIENTPFTAVRFDDKWILTLGKYRLTEYLDSLDACKQDANDASWFRIMQIIQIMINEHEAEKLKPKTVKNLNTEEITKLAEDNAKELIEENN